MSQEPPSPEDDPVSRILRMAGQCWASAWPRSASCSATSARARSTPSRNASSPSTASRPPPSNILGVLSLIFWSLMIVVTSSTSCFIMRADNRGEGGIMALLALLQPRERRPKDAADPHRARALRRGAALRRRRHHASDLGARRGRGARGRRRRHSRPCVRAGHRSAILVALFAFQRRGTGARRRSSAR